MSLRFLAFLSLPLLTLIFITPQAFIVAFIYSDWISLSILLISIFGIVFYSLGYFIMLKVASKREFVFTLERRIIFWVLFYIYVLSYVALYVNSQGIPLVSYIFNGGETSELRAQFHKGQEGFWVVFVYFISILGKGFIPFAMVVIRKEASALTFWVSLFVVAFFAVSAFEKIYLAWVFVPILIYELYYGTKFRFLFIFLLFVVFFVGVSRIALSSDLSGEVSLSEHSVVREYANLNHTSYHDAPKHSLVHARDAAGPSVEYYRTALSSQETYQFLLFNSDTDGMVQYMINRLVWIPFVTAYDTLLYWSNTYDFYMLFSVNRYFSKILGIEYANLEKRVFMMQFETDETTTGNANAYFMVEAYVAFGILGVLLFPLGLGAIFGTISSSGIKVFLPAIPITAAGLISVSLISTLFSGGLLLMLFLYTLFCRKVPR